MLNTRNDKTVASDDVTRQAYPVIDDECEEGALQWFDASTALDHRTAALVRKHVNQLSSYVTKLCITCLRTQ